MEETCETRESCIQKAKKRLKAHLPQIIGGIIGGIGGYIYYYKVGCSTGSCPIKSNPWLMTLWGAIMGYLIIDILLPTFNKLNAMKKNMGAIDKLIRILIAVVIVVLYFTHVISGTLEIILLILAVIFALTSLIGFCPLYLPFGINTEKKKE